MRAVALVVVLAGVPATAVARAQEGQATFDRGAALAAERKYDEAAQAFAAAYELDHRKETLFAWAQVERLRGNCAAAVPLYRRFLTSADLTPAQSDAAALSIRRCEAEPEPRPEPPPRPPAPASPSAPPAVVTAPAPSTPARSRRAVMVTGLMLGTAVAS